MPPHLLIISRTARAPLGGFLLGSWLLLWGCAHSSRPATPIKVQSKPAISGSALTHYKNPEINFAHYETFSIYPFSTKINGGNRSELLEKQLLFFLRNELEQKGYRFVRAENNPKFLVTLNMMDLSESVVPSTATTAPPPDLESLKNQPTWGAYSSDSASYVPPDTVQVLTIAPKKTIKKPAASVFAFDAVTKDPIWNGSGTVEAEGVDSRISGQYAIAAALENFPAFALREAKSERGAIGARIGIYTSDIISYYPRIISFADLSPARDAGIREGDTIVSVNGVSLSNKSFHEAMSHIRGEPDSIVTFEILRDKETRPVKVKRLPWSEVWGNLIGD